MTFKPEHNVVKLCMSEINLFLYKARVFVRIGWKSLPGTNILAYYKNS
jgi:hypothetical protein